jgi:hypothetical protein
MPLLDKNGKPMAPPKIAVLIPTHEMVPYRWALDLAGLVGETTQYLMPDGSDKAEIVFDIRAQTGTYLHSMRQELIEYQLTEGITHALWLDSDMSFPNNALLRLLAHNQDMVGINYSQRSPTPDFVAIKKAGWDGEGAEKLVTDENSKGLEEVDVIGFGMVLIRTSALRDLPNPDKGPWFWFEWIKKTRQQIGEDAYFCRLMQKSGRKIYVDHDLSKECRHIGQYEYSLNNVNAFREVMATMKGKA